MEINVVYDFFNKEYIPNGLNYRYLRHYLDDNFKEHNSFNNISNEYFERLPTVWKRDDVLLHLIANKIESISNINTNNKDVMYLFSVCIFGGGLHSFGCPYSLNEGYTFLEFISKKSINYIKTAPNFYLFINFTNEGVTDYRFFENLYKDLERFGIPFNKVIYSTGDYNIDCILTNWLNSKKRQDDKIKVVYGNWSFPGKRQDFINDTNYLTKKNITNIVIKNKLRPYKFLMFNRRIRLHRFYSILYFHHNKIIDDILISYDFITNTDVNKYYSNLSDMFNIEKNTIEHSYKDLITNFSKKTIDVDDIHSMNGIGCNDNTQPYLDSYIHITSETSVFEGSGYFSEKTWKPIANLQPFIMMGSYKALYKLKEMGFKTFHPFINEEYDLIENNEDRFVMILKEIERLSKLSTEEIHKWYYSIQDVLLYNQRLFFNENTIKKYLYEFKKDILSINGY